MSLPQGVMNTATEGRNVQSMAHSNPESENNEEQDPLNDSWFDKPGRSLTPVQYPSERPSYDFVEARPSDMDLDDAWFV